jgi:hypothetical protein
MELDYDIYPDIVEGMTKKELKKWDKSFDSEEINACRDKERQKELIPTIYNSRQTC